MEDCLSVLDASMMKIVNLLLGRGSVPITKKSEKVTSLIKKISLDGNDLKNYRSVSNLTFISKLIERALAADLNNYVHDNELGEPLQSAYRPRNNTEIALLRVENDIIHRIDGQKDSCIDLI